ncbi:MAG: lysyl oxidase family protein [Kofleriaceae bacterium]
MKRIALCVLAACGDNAAGGDATNASDAHGIDADAAAMPDLTLLGEHMADSFVLTNDSFAPDSCEVQEQCVVGAGPRRLLRFDTVTANLGTTDLVLGTPPPRGVSDATFTWSPCHLHHHVLGYAVYELRDGNGVVLTSHKQAFCLQDIQQIRAGAPSHGYSCTHQGMSAGWADVYGRALPCQWIDVTEVPAGSYTLRIVVNPAFTLPDSDPSNNELTFPVML